MELRSCKPPNMAKKNNYNSSNNKKITAISRELCVSLSGCCWNWHHIHSLKSHMAWLCVGCFALFFCVYRIYWLCHVIHLIHLQLHDWSLSLILTPGCTSASFGEILKNSNAWVPSQAKQNRITPSGESQTSIYFRAPRFFCCSTIVVNCWTYPSNSSWLSNLFYNCLRCIGLDPEPFLP